MIAKTETRERHGQANNAGADIDMPFNRKHQWWSWTDIVEHADQLGIPNFQRGAVWDTGNRTALLESMYEQSPCGSFVLWAPEDEGNPLRHGVPLRAFGAGVEPMWLVDGQQRTRAMLDTFEQLLTVPTDSNGWALVREAELDSLRSLGTHCWLDIVEDDEEGVDGDAEGAHFWGVVLPAMRAFDQTKRSYFRKHSESRNVLRGSMFRRLSPRARFRLNSQGREKTVPPLPVGVIPLATLLAPKASSTNGRVALCRRVSPEDLRDRGAGSSSNWINSSRGARSSSLDTLRAAYICGCSADTEPMG